MGPCVTQHDATPFLAGHRSTTCQKSAAAVFIALGSSSIQYFAPTSPFVTTLHPAAQASTTVRLNGSITVGRNTNVSYRANSAGISSYGTCSDPCGAGTPPPQTSTLVMLLAWAPPP